MAYTGLGDMLTDSLQATEFRRQELARQQEYNTMIGKGFAPVYGAPTRRYNPTTHQYEMFTPVQSWTPPPAQPAQTNINVSPAIQTQVSPMISPIFQQQFQPQNSPLTGGTQQQMPTTQSAPQTQPAPAQQLPPVSQPAQAQSSGPTTDQWAKLIDVLAARNSAAVPAETAAPVPTTPLPAPVGPASPMVNVDTTLQPATPTPEATPQITTQQPESKTGLFIAAGAMLLLVLFSTRNKRGN